MSVFSNTYFEQGIVILDTSNATNVTTGSFVTYGGASFGKTVQVGQDAYIGGNLFVNGTTVTVNTTTVNVSDNTFLLNSGPSGSRDAGIVIQRYQVDNNSGTGDLVSANEPVALSTSITSGSSTTAIILGEGASIVDDAYTNYWIKITSGDLSGAVRKITAYAGASKTATLSSALATTPAGTETINLYNRNYFTEFYDEADDEFVFGFTTDVTDVKTAIITAGLGTIRTDKVMSSMVSSTNIKVDSISVGSMALSGLFLDTLTVGSLFVTNGSNLQGGLTSGAILVSNASVVVDIGISTGTVSASIGSFGNGLTAGSLNVTGQSILSGGLTSGAMLVSNASLVVDIGVSTGNVSASFGSFSDALTAGSITAVNGITSGAMLISNASLVVDVGVSTGNVNASFGSFTNALTAGSITAVNGITSGAMLISNASLVVDLGISTGNVNASFGSFTNALTAGSITAVNGITSGAMLISNASLVVDLGISTGNVSASFGSFTNALTAGSITAVNGITSGAMLISNASLVVDIGISTGNVSASFGNFTESITTSTAIFNTGITSGTIMATSGVFTAGLTAGSLNVTGESVIKSVNVTPSQADIVKELVATAGNNISTPTAVQGFAFNVSTGSFDAIATVRILTTDDLSNKYALYSLKGVHVLSGWVLNSSFTGDLTGITFSIDSNGQINYTSSDVSGFISDNISFRALTTTIPA